MLIREIADQDIDAVAEVHVRAWQKAYAGIVPAEMLDVLDPVEFARARRSRSAEPGVTTLVAVDGSIHGFVSAGPYRDVDRDCGELYAIYVDPDRWGNGAGRALLTAAADHLRRLGFTEMLLWVFEDNAGSRRFYERMGLRPDGAKQHYTPRGSDARLPEIRYAARL